MKIIVESTTKIIELNGVPVRVWEGKTESGIPVHCFISRVAVDRNESPEILEQFAKELTECKVPENADIQGYPLRLII